MKTSIIGLGWFGQALAQKLKKQGHEVWGTTRTTAKKSLLEKSDLAVQVLQYPDLPGKELLDADVVILNIPPFPQELSWFKSWPWDPKAWVIFISSTALYSPHEQVLSHPLHDQEEWIKSTFKNWTVLRFGGLIGGGRHPGKFLSGKDNIKGRLWPVNLIHQSDAVGFALTVLERELKSKTFHVVSDDHPTKEAFYTDFCQQNGLPLPSFDQHDQTLGKIVPNEEMKKYYSRFHPLTIE